MERLSDQYRVPREIVEIWAREEGMGLLEIQSLALEKYGLFDSNNLLITAPSSSGKTFVGEMASINSYYEGKKAIFLVPLKAIAEEKYFDFNKKYGEFGLRIAISTHDRAEYDDSISAGYFDIAIIIYEKMNILLTQNPALLNSCGLVVIDELQLLNEKNRGSELEILLTKIKILKESTRDRFQFIGLSAVLGDLNKFDTWLEASNCKTLNRPLELHEGVLSINGDLNIKCFNNGKEYTENIPGISGIRIPTNNPTNFRERQELGESILRRLIVICRHYLSSNKKILIFRKWRALARDTATRLARELGLPPATEVINALGSIESSNSKEALIQCLSSGVAFHNADLPVEARFLIENDFRKADGQIKVISATSTLAMGVNMPASVVIIPDTFKIDPDAEGFHEIPLTASEYKNMSGRAGRTRYGEEGISIIISHSPAETTRYYRNYINGRLDNIKPALRDKDLRKIMLSLVSGGICKNLFDIEQLLLASYTGFVYWNITPQTREPFIITISRNVEFLHKNRMLDYKEDRTFFATKIGKLCSASGVDIDTFVMLQRTLNKIDIINWDIWEIVFPCLHCNEMAEQIKIYIRTAEWERTDLFNLLNDLNPNNQELLKKWSLDTTGSLLPTLRRIKAFLMLYDWINGLEMRRIEEKFSPGEHLSGTITRIAEITSWLVETMRKIAFTMDCDLKFVKELKILAERLARGVPAQGIALDKLNVSGINRPLIKRILDAGYDSLDKILETPSEDFRGVISPRLAQRLQEAIVKESDESQERAKHVQVLRLENLGRNSQVIKNIYEKEGIELEHAIVEVLNEYPLELGAERISKQREGEPDIRLALSEGLLVGSVTASRHNITDRKSAEIIRSGAPMNPSSYIIFGRPGFHDSAIKNAGHINTQLGAGKTYKLISIKDFGELFVRVVEGKLSKESFVDILMNKQGHIEAQLLSI